MFEVEQETQQQEKTQRPKLKLKLDFNTKSFEAYQKEKVESPHEVRGEMARIDKFISKAKQEKDLEIILESMHRRPKTYLQDGKRVTKDYLTFVVSYHAKDWLDNDLWIRSHQQGWHKIPKFRKETSFDPETGEHIIKKVFDGEFETFYDIELNATNRKKIIQDIVTKCDGTLMENVVFYYHVPPSGTGIGFRCAIYTYDQFINSSIEELEKLARTTPSPVAYQQKDKKSYMG